MATSVKWLADAGGLAVLHLYGNGRNIHFRYKAREIQLTFLPFDFSFAQILWNDTRSLPLPESGGQQNDGIEAVNRQLRLNRKMKSRVSTCYVQQIQNPAWYCLIVLATMCEDSGSMLL